MGKYEEKLISLAREKDCKGINCGHIHIPANKKIEDIHYLNSGDWVESLTALVEYFDGSFEILTTMSFAADWHLKNKKSHNLLKWHKWRVYHKAF